MAKLSLGLSVGPPWQGTGRGEGAGENHLIEKQQITGFGGNGGNGLIIPLNRMT
jgi:hypothetical protein